MNVFEGCRRLALLAGILTAAGTLFALVNSEPYLSVSYTKVLSVASFQRMTTPCPSASATRYFTTTSKSGSRVSIDLCLPPMAFGNDARQLIPYRVDEKNMVWGAEPYSSEVSNYEKELEAQFALPGQDDDWLEQQLSHRYWKSLGEGIAYLVLGLSVFAAAVHAVGWIARGFMGIPRGKDRKQASEA